MTRNFSHEITSYKIFHSRITFSVTEKQIQNRMLVYYVNSLAF
ncbi:hypothetical protein SJAV_08840 [Sulfurisphaera javensis]|uniref:Transposase n=1 Tax=Sulfurisphaera javensis TaxID=2049879 RepID=A0AAT9GQ25_9CREN